MRRGQPLQRQRRAVFIGCEGESERSYVRVLQRHADAAALPLHFVTPILAPGAGDPLQLVRRAKSEYANEVRKRGRNASFLAHAILMDEDRREDDPARFAVAEREASHHGFALLLQRPKHEAFLLRHLPGHHMDQPARQDAERRLRDAWPGYRKGLPATELAVRIDLAAIRRACGAEPEIADFLIRIGFTAWTNRA